MKRLLRYLLTRRFDSDLEAEIHAHIQEKTEAHLAAGLPFEEARARALREFGNRTRVAETCRESWGTVALDQLSADLRYAVRMLRKSPLFTFVAIFSLAMGIGVNTITFSVIDSVLLHPLPYPESQRLVAVWGHKQSSGSEHLYVSPADFYDWRAHSRSFSSLAAFSTWPMNLTNVDTPRKLHTQLVSAAFFAVLRVQPEFGRIFQETEDAADARPVVVLSHRLWRSLGAPRLASGLTLNGSDYTIVGVMPAGFSFPSPDVEAWVPLSLSAANRANREARWLQVVGRLNAHTTLAQAHSEMELIAAQLAAAYPATNSRWSVSLLPLQDEVVGKTSAILWTLQAGTLLLLVATCANLANLLLARSASRTREVGMRTALGASRGRIVRQFLVESFVLSLAGGALGLAMAQAAVAAIRTLPESILPRASEISMSVPVLLAAISVSALTAIVFGVAPALRASQMDLKNETAMGSRGTFRGADTKRGLLVSVELATAVVLLVGAGLLCASAVRLISTPPGLRVENLLTVSLSLPHSQYQTTAAQEVLLQRVLERVSILPGVSAAAFISDTPLAGNNPTLEMVPDPSAVQSSNVPLRAGFRVVSPEYFATAGIPVLRGRSFNIGDRANSQPVAIANHSMARRLWGAGDAVARRIRIKENSEWMLIVGVVHDVKQLGLKAEEGPVLYIPYSQNTQAWMSWSTLIVRAAVQPAVLLPSLRNTIHGIDKRLPLDEVGTLDQVLSHATAIPRFVAATAGLLSVFSLLIAVIGVHGLVAYTVERRIPELGIRVALGASRFQISALLFRGTMIRVFAGLACGLVVAWWVARLIASQLFEIRPHDPAIFAGVAAGLGFSSLLAILGPARRAFTIDPSAALRAE
jgi:putative ABC transport system permease protein